MGGRPARNMPRRAHIIYYTTMRLKEEKILILLGILAALIIASNLLLQFSSFKIGVFYNNITQQQLELIDVYNNVMQSRNNLSDFRLYEFLKADVSLDANRTENVTDIMKRGYMKNEYIALDQKRRNKEITSEQFIKEAKSLYEKEYFNLYTIYIERKTALLNKLNNKTPWIFWNAFFIFLQTFLIILNLLGYSWLFLKIKHRLN